MSSTKINKKTNKHEEVERELPDFKSPAPKNKRETQDWNRMSERMEGFHSYFRTTFQTIWEMSDKLEVNKIPLSAYLAKCVELNEHLTMHHGIEEQHVFPVLAKRMPEFRDDHPQEHDQIHKGMDRFMNYVNKVKEDPKSYSSDDFRKVLSSWGPALMHHLDAEVHTLRGENLRRYYTLEEVRALPM